MHDFYVSFPHNKINEIITNYENEFLFTSEGIYENKYVQGISWQSEQSNWAIDRGYRF